MINRDKFKELFNQSLVKDLLEEKIDIDGWRTLDHGHYGFV